jgi:hypothetical protein
MCQPSRCLFDHRVPIYGAYMVSPEMCPNHFPEPALLKVNAQDTAAVEIGEEFRLAVHDMDILKEEWKLTSVLTIRTASHSEVRSVAFGGPTDRGMVGPRIRQEAMFEGEVSRIQTHAASFVGVSRSVPMLICWIETYGRGLPESITFGRVVSNRCSSDRKDGKVRHTASFEPNGLGAHWEMRAQRNFAC